MNILGIDPSLTGTGFAGTSGRTWTIGSRDPSDTRLIGLWGAVHLAAQAMDLVVIEDMPGARTESAGKVGMAHGVVRTALLDMGVPYVKVPPASLKKFATGRGTADKADMRVELVKRMGIDIKDDNEVDAWWLRQLGLCHYGRADLALPKLHTDALLKIDWAEAPQVVAA